MAPRTDSDPPNRSTFYAAPNARVITSWAVVLGVLATAFYAGGIYTQMPTSDQLARLDAKHAQALAEVEARHAQRDADLQRQVSEHADRIAGMAGQVSFLVRLEVEQAKRAGDPVTRRIVVEAARETRAQARVSGPDSSRGNDPLAGIDLEE